jgi:hypothetical protein
MAGEKKVLCGKFGWYQFERTVPTNISQGYLGGSDASRWNELAALRECVQNALDEAQFQRNENGGALTDYCSITYGNTHILLRDTGRGVDFSQIFLLGESGKRGQGYRGEKGEGQLMAFLVLTKIGIPIQMFSRDWMVVPRFDTMSHISYLAWVSNADDHVVAPAGEREFVVMVLDLYRRVPGQAPLVGTIWKIGLNYNLKEIVQDIGSYFPDISKRQAHRNHTEDVRQWARQRKEDERQKRRERQFVVRNSISSSKMVFLPAKGKPKRLYLKGMFIRDLSGAWPSLFSYNLENVPINRDRDMVDQGAMYDEVSQALSSEDMTPRMLQMYWRQAIANSGSDHYIEYTRMPEMYARDDEWRQAFRKEFGWKSCIGTNHLISADATSEGWKVVTLNPVATGFAKGLGIKTDALAGNWISGQGYKSVNASKKEDKVIGLCQKFGELLGIKSYPVEIAGKVVDADVILGWYKDNTVHILRSTFAMGGLEVLKTYLHECGHGATGEGDYSRKFTNWFLVGWASIVDLPMETLSEMKKIKNQLEVL